MTNLYSKVKSKIRFGFLTRSILFFLLLSGTSLVKAQAPCDATFTGLSNQMCSADPSVILVPTTPGGTFTGPGMTGSTFNPAVAGPGNHTITYTVSQAAGSTYAHSSIPYQAQPTVGNFVTLGDDAMSGSLPIGFTFTFYGNPYTQFDISSNGFITFTMNTNNSGCCSGQFLPQAGAPDNLVAAIWDDLYPPGNGTVGYSTFGVAPNRYTVITWKDIPFCCNNTPAVSTSIVLYETTNIIEVHTEYANSADPATMGIENEFGTAATVELGFNSTLINVQNHGSRYTPVAPCTLNTSSQNITVLPAPLVSAAASPAAICPGVSTTLTATGATTYVWNPGNLTGATNSVSPITTTVYTVVGTDGNGCNNTATVNVTVTAQLPITVASNPAVLCGGATATLTAGGATNYTWQPGNLTGTTVNVSPAVTSTYTVVGTDANNCSGSAIFTLPVAALNNLTITPNAVPCADSITVNVPAGAGPPANAAKYYIRDFDPWSTQNNTNAMTAVFGANGFTTTDFTSANPAIIFAPTTQFVFLEGSDNNALALNNFVTNNLTAIENWVNTGGRLFLNAAPNQGTNMTWGFGGVILNYNNAQGSVNAVNPAHPIFNGPYTPVTTAYTGGSYSHAHITGGNATAVMQGGGVNVLSELQWGSGRVMFGGITSPNFHQPAIEAQNLWQNIIDYTANAAGSLNYTYNWSNNATTQTIQVTTPGTYTVTVSGYGCTGTATYVANGVNPVVTATASPSAFCIGGSTTLTASGANTYIWQPGNLTGATQTLSPLVTTTYTVSGTNGAGCIGMDSIEVTVSPIPTVTIVQSGVNCADTLYAVVTGVNPGTPTPGAKFYIRDTDPWSTANNTNAMNAVFGVGNYQTLNFNAAAPATVFAPTTQFVFLEGSDGNATAMNTYVTANLSIIENWVNAGGRLFINAAPNQGGNMNWGFGGTILDYSNAQSNVTATNPTHPIFMGPSLPTATSMTGNSYSHAHVTGTGLTQIITGSGLNVLAGKQWGSGYVMFGGITSPNYHTPQLEAQNVWQNILHYTANAAFGPSLTYQWSNNATTPYIIPPTSGVYTVTVTSAGCSATATFNATVNNPPAISVSATLSTVCPGQTTTITATGANTYTWMPGSLTGGVINVNPATTTTYTVVGSSAAGCSATQTITIQVTSQIPISATASPTTICIAGTSTLTASGATTYTWMPGNLTGTSVNVSPVTSTTYTVTGSDQAGCSGTTTVSVIVSPNPTVTATASPSNNICQGDQVTLSGAGATTYTWSGGVTNGVAFSPAATATYTVTGTNAAGCINNTTITVTVSPNTTPPPMNITSNPAVVLIGQNTTYTANIPGAISNYTINWYRNNIFLQSTNSPTNFINFTPTSNADSVHAQIIPTGCFNPDSVKTNYIAPKLNSSVGDIDAPNGFVMYPNPTNDVVYIDGLQKGDELVITDLVGRTIIREVILSSDKYQINMKPYANGAYHAKFVRGDKKWVIKLMKD